MRGGSEIDWLWGHTDSMERITPIHSTLLAYAPSPRLYLSYGPSIVPILRKDCAFS